MLIDNIKTCGVEIQSMIMSFKYLNLPQLSTGTSQKQKEREATDLGWRRLSGRSDSIREMKLSPLNREEEANREKKCLIHSSEYAMFNLRTCAASTCSNR